MPLVKGSSRAAVSSNIRTEKASGKKQAQAVAIALNVARKGRADGGATPWFTKQEARSEMRTGGLHGSTGGRDDHLPIAVPSGAHVVPSDVISGIGGGNTAHGMKVMHSMFGSGPYGSPAPKGVGHLTAPKPMAAPKPPKGLGYANGGGIGKPVEIMASDGEFVISPETVAKIGGGDMNHGHAILDKWIVHERKKHIKKLKSLPGPSKD